MMMDFNWHSTDHDKYRFNLYANDPEITTEIYHAFKHRVNNAGIDNKLATGISYDYLDALIRQGISKIELMFKIAMCLKVNGNEAIDKLCDELIDRYNEARGLPRRNPSNQYNYRNNLVTIYTITRALNNVYNIFSASGQGRLIFGGSALDFTAPPYVDKSGYADTSALVMMMTEVPDPLRALDIVSYPFLARKKILTKDEYIAELLNLIQCLPKEDHWIVRLAIQNIHHFIATTHWYIDKISYGLRNRLDNGPTTQPTIFDTKGKTMLPATIITFFCLPLLIFYNYWLVRRWGWLHHYSVGAKRTVEFKKQITGAFSYIDLNIHRHMRAYLETLALCLVDTTHLLPMERTDIFKHQAFILESLTNDSTLTQTIGTLMSMVENYEVDQEQYQLAKDNLYTALSLLAVHLGEEQNISPRFLQITLYWLANNLVEKQDILLREATTNRDIVTWLSI